MPHLDVSTFATQIFWAILCFTVLYIFLSTFAVPKTSEILEERKKLIDDYIFKANAMKKKAEKALHDYNEALSKANEEANLKIADAIADLKEFVGDKERKLHEDLAAQISQTQKKVEMSKIKAIKEADSVSVTLALSVIKKIGIDDISEKEIERSV
ncbi:MAG: hypothetical protein ACK5N8_02850 [Alphaproteobacteria bacterium]